VIVFETIGNTTTVPCFNNDPMLVAAPLIRAASISVVVREEPRRR
jgi:hypothetical protein